MHNRSRLGLFLAPFACLAGVGCQPAPDAEPEAGVGRVQQAIVGGSYAPELAYPWMVEIMRNDNYADPTAPKDFKHFCGGSLIARDWVLTAGHCVSQTLNEGGSPTEILPLEPDDFKLTIGEWYSLGNLQPGEQEIEIEEIFLHPDYQVVYEDGAAVQPYHDVALLKLKEQAVLNEKARLIRLTSENDTPGTETWLAGWGSDGYLDPSPLLKELSATVVDPDNEADPQGGCNARLLAENQQGGVDFYREVDQPYEVCSLNFDSVFPNIHSACYHDSGGAVATWVNGCPEQIGVHFWGDSLCSSYNVASRVSAYLPWIREHGVDYIGDRIYEAEAESIYKSTGGAHDSTGGDDPDGWNLWSNGYMSFDHEFNGGQQQMVIRASGQFAAYEWPRMRVRVGGTVVDERTVTSTAWADYNFSFYAPPGESEVRIEFVNDYYDDSVNPAVDRNLFIDKVKVIDDRQTCLYLDSIETQLEITTDWGSGYCAVVHITNPVPLPTVDWSLILDTGDSSVYDSWNPDDAYFGTGDHTVEPVGEWHKVIQPDETDSQTGFCAYRLGQPTTLPEIVSATASFY